MIRFSLTICLAISLFVCYGQQKETNDFEVYVEQAKVLLQTRGVAQNLVSNYVKEFRKNNITSDEDLAVFLSRIYPQDHSNAFLFYVYDNNQLKITLLTPGKLVSQKKIGIKKEELSLLFDQIGHKLGIKQAAVNRTPIDRGVTVRTTLGSSKLSLDSLLARATKLLLPEEFNERYTHLTIIPALNIGTFPYHLLRPYKDKSFLIEKCSFMISPGIIDFIGKRLAFIGKYDRGFDGGYDLSADYSTNFLTGKVMSRYKINLNNALLVGNPSYPKDQKYSFPDLPGATKEILGAARYLIQPKVLLGDQATKSSVLKHLNTSHLAYFATHGISDQIDPLNKSFLVLSGKESYLTAKEIMNFKASQREKGLSTSARGSFPETVILSACQTGLGQAVDGGMIGMARSFLLAGSDNVIMSLWSVDDDATALLMNRFMYHLQKPHKYVPSDPLRLATLDAMKKYPNYLKWASFSAFGIDYGFDNYYKPDDDRKVSPFDIVNIKKDTLFVKSAKALSLGAKVDVFRVSVNQTTNTKVLSGRVVKVGAYTTVIKLEGNLANDAAYFILNEQIPVMPIKLSFDKNSFSLDEIKAIKLDLVENNLVVFDEHADILLEKGEKGDIIKFKTTSARFAEIARGDSYKTDLNNKLTLYAKFKYLQDLVLKNPSLNVDVSIIPIKNDTLNYQDHRTEFKEDEQFVMHVKNNGEKAVYINVIDLAADGLITSFLPQAEANIYPADLSIKAGEEKLFKNVVFTVSPPYGLETLKVFVSESVIDIKGYSFH
ncbi:MAG: CHAT domain-containing protein [Pedobacter sp.]|nr:MAG: CHAT domain-containing protein [Pedobacter sp.]